MKNITAARAIATAGVFACGGVVHTYATFWHTGEVTYVTAFCAVAIMPGADQVTSADVTCPVCLTIAKNLATAPPAFLAESGGH